MRTGTERARTRRARSRGMSQESGAVIGATDKDYNIICFAEQCLSNALRLETYARDAERDGDSELAEFFRRAQGESRKDAELGRRCCARGSRDSQGERRGSWGRRAASSSSGGTCARSVRALGARA